MDCALQINRLQKLTNRVERGQPRLAEELFTSNFFKPAYRAGVGSA